MSAEKKNPIAEQSKKWLTDALFQLMEEAPYEKITISEITDRAGLSRRTFYRNFSRKEDLLTAYSETICGEYIACLQKEPDLSLPGITMVFFTFWLNHLEFLQLLEKNNLLFLLLQKLNEFIPHVYRMVKGDPGEFDCGEDLKYALTFSVGGYWNMLSAWLKDEAAKTPDELAAVIRRAILVNAEKMKRDR